MIRNIACLLATLFLPLALQSQELPSNVLTPELLWSLGRVSLMDVSPDQKTVLYGVTYYDIEGNSGNTDLYTVQVDGSTGKKPNRLTNTPKSEYNAVFRPDGKKIGYLKGGHLWEMDVNGSNQNKVSDQEMNGFQYSPDGKKILFIRDVDYSGGPNPLLEGLPKADVRIIDDLMYRHWDHWEDASFSNIFYATYSDGKILGDALNIQNEPFDSPLMPFGGMEQISWSPDSKYIAYTCKKLSGVEYAKSTDSNIYLYELESGKTTNLSNGMKGYDMEPVFSKDGRYLAWNSMRTPGYEADRNRIFIYDFQSKESWEMTSGLDESTNSPRWSSDGRQVYFTAGRLGTYQIYLVDFDREGKMRQTSAGNFDYGNIFVLDDFIIATRMSMSQPTEIVRITKDAARATPLTYTNDEALANIEMGKIRKRVIQTTDGKPMHVWVIYPPGFDETKSYPALLYCQGGPQSAVSQFWSYRWNFQMMAANGYVVVAPNRRGLPSFGEEWNAEISGDWGGQAMQDLLTAIDTLSTEPYIDESRLGAVGASFGGYSIYWLAGNHDKRFKTFISHSGVYNLESWYGETEEVFFANHDMGGAYWEKDQPETYKLDSPHLYARNWDTPILVIHGQKDFRIPVTEGMQAFQAAKLQGIPSRFLYFPDEGHWVLKPQNGILWQRVFFDWLGRSLKP
ncbi:MAG: S9 family peptidase [Saprospiraceae bacterium]|nr:S9 family peptidase [Saprospiraceae bacterium]